MTPSPPPRPATSSTTRPDRPGVVARADGARPEPEGRLASAARVLWTLEILSVGLVAVVIAFAVRGVLTGQDGLLHAIGEAGPWLLLVAVLGSAAIVPALRTKRWRWRLDEQELDLRHGTITEIRTIVPVARIQHVDVRRSPWAQLAGVAAVVVHTAAGTTEIPVLTEHEAADVRDRLAGLIRTPDDD
jgi:membrane protein YdbS with pleckstrin-like domain